MPKRNTYRRKNTRNKTKKNYQRGGSSSPSRPPPHSSSSYTPRTPNMSDYSFVGLYDFTDPSQERNWGPPLRTTVLPQESIGTDRDSIMSRQRAFRGRALRVPFSQTDRVREGDGDGDRDRHRGPEEINRRNAEEAIRYYQSIANEYDEKQNQLEYLEYAVQLAMSNVNYYDRILMQQYPESP